MKKKKKDRIINKSISIIVVVIILAAWFLTTNLNIADPMLVPSPQKVGIAFIYILTEGYKGHTLLQHLGISMERLLAAFLLALVTAVPLGLLSGFSNRVRAAFEPIIEFYRPLPPLAYYTLLVLALGIGNESKIALLFLACFAPIYVSCVSAVSRVNKDYINSSYTLGASRLQTFFSVICPACLPDIFTGLKTSIGVGYSTLVAAEMVAANSGIGWMVLDAKNWLRNDIVFVGIIVMGFTGILITVILNIIQKKMVPWSGKV